MGQNANKSLIEEENLLSQYDLQLLKIFWDCISDKHDLGLKIMIRILKSESDIKKLWIFASNVENENDMLKNAQIIYHANKVIEKIDKIVISLTSTICESDQSSLIQLGKIHYHYGIKKEHFKIFEDCFVESLEENIQGQNIKFDEISKQAWRKFIQFIFRQYLNGMQKEQKEVGKILIKKVKRASIL